MEASMNALHRIGIISLLCSLSYHPHAALAFSQPDATTTLPDRSADARDSQHDFDFEFGSWNAHVRRLLHPLTGSDTWINLTGTSIVRKVWGGRANLGELEISSSTAHIEGLSMRLYNPQSHQWSIYWANSNDGNLGTPMIGQFNNG